MSYTTSTYYKAYFLARNIDVTAQLDIDIDAALLVATEYLDDIYEFVGIRVLESQDNKWPRSGAYTSENILLSSATIPDKIQQATCELAYIEQTQAGGLQPLFNGKVISKEADSIGTLSTSIEYDTASSEAYDGYYSKAVRKIQDLITSKSNSVFRLQRVL